MVFFLYVLLLVPYSCIRVTIRKLDKNKNIEHVPSPSTWISYAMLSGLSCIQSFPVSGGCSFY